MSFFLSPGERHSGVFWSSPAAFFLPPRAVIFHNSQKTSVPLSHGYCAPIPVPCVTVVRRSIFFLWFLSLTPPSISRMYCLFSQLVYHQAACAEYLALSPGLLLSFVTPPFLVSVGILHWDFVTLFSYAPVQPNIKA